MAYRYLDVGPRRLFQTFYNTPEKRAARPWAPLLNWVVITTIYILTALAIYHRKVIFAAPPDLAMPEHIARTWEYLLVGAINVGAALTAWGMLRTYRTGPGRGADSADRTDDAGRRLEPMLNLDITQSNAGIDRLLAVTTNPRHRYILMNYSCHRYLQFSGRYDEVLADDMMVENPVYNLHALSFNTTITGKDQVRTLYKYWADTNQCIFYGENEQVAVADNFVASTVMAHQQVWGGSILSSKALGLLPKTLS